MFDATITDVRMASNLSNEEKVMVVLMGEWTVTEYENMTLEDILTEDTSSRYTLPSMEDVRDDKARERALDQLLDLVERMNKGMSMIKECDERLAWFKAGNYVPRNVFMSWVTRKNKLWSHWKALQAQAHSLGVWADYYKLLNEEISTYWTVEQEGIDHLSEQSERAMADWKQQFEACLLDAHLEEMAAYDVRVELPIRTGGYVPPCRDVTHQYTQPHMSEEAEWESLMASCPF